MTHFPIFLSAVFVIRNQAERLGSILSEAVETFSGLVSDFELIVIDNKSDDESVAVLKTLTTTDGLPNLQVYALTKEVDLDTASWIGIESALGDFVAVINPLSDDIAFMPAMLEKAHGGADVVFAKNTFATSQSVAYRAANGVFNRLYEKFNGIHLGRDAPQYRVLNRSVVSFILQHPQPSMTYRHLPASGGFARVNLEYEAEPTLARKKHLGESIDRGMRLLVSTTRAPMRLVTFLSLFGAVANLLYSFYVVGVGLFKDDVEPGWVSTSVQMSGMFFLISLVLLVLGEYVLHMASLSGEGPGFRVGQEFKSARMTRHEQLNVEEAASPRVPPRGSR